MKLREKWRRLNGWQKGTIVTAALLALMGATQDGEKMVTQGIQAPPIGANKALPPDPPAPIARPNADAGAPAPVTSPDPGPAPSPAVAPVRGEAVEVLRVVDGDTIEVMLDGKAEKVRLIGVDTPEVHGGVQPYGPEASDFTKGRLGDQRVTLEFDVEERDRYGRLLAYVWVDDQMFNEILVREGYAQVMTIPPNVRYADRFVSLQREAREAGRGLWADTPAPGTTPAPAPGSSQAPTPSAGSGAFAPDASGNCNGQVKGNIAASGEKIYHVPGGSYYDRTRAEECFTTPGAAQAAGYRASQR